MQYLYGLNICSQIPLPLIKVADNKTIPDVNVYLDMTLEFPVDADLRLHWAQVNRNEVAYNRRDIGFFTIRNGNEIRVRPLDGVGDSQIANCLMGLPMGYLLYQRGLHVIHASVVVLQGNDEASAFVGMTGMGKSTMAASFLARGHSIMGEDVAAIDLSHECPRIIPAFPWLKIEAEVFRKLNLPEKRLIQSSTDLRDRFWYPLDGLQFCADPSPLKRCYFLGWGENFKIEPVSRLKALLMMFSHTYRPTGPDASRTAEGESFKMTADFVKKSSFYQLTRPKSLDRLDEFSQRIEDHMRL